MAAATKVRILVRTGFYFALLMESAFHDGATEKLVATLTTQKLSNKTSTRKDGFDIGSDRLVNRTLRCGRTNLVRNLVCTGFYFALVMEKAIHDGTTE